MGLSSALTVLQTGWQTVGICVYRHEKVGALGGLPLLPVKLRAVSGRIERCL